MSAAAGPRPFRWSVRRELWEHRGIFIAPLAVAGIALLSYFLSAMVRLPGRVRGLAAMTAEQQRAVISNPYGIAASIILLTGFLVSAYYCLDALHGERRDRSILFWKSLPVSDRTTVLAKAAVVFGVMPLWTYAVALGAQLLMLTWATVVVAVSGVGATAVWTRLPLPTMSVIMAYGLAAHVLWFAPLYGWLLMASAWARRAPLLWAVVPPLAVGMVEHITFGTRVFPTLMRYRFLGGMQEAFRGLGKNGDVERLGQLDPIGFLTTAGLWLGLLAALGFVAACVRLRRMREPL